MPRFSRGIRVTHIFSRIEKLGDQCRTFWRQVPLILIAHFIKSGFVRDRQFFVYIMASRPWGTLYVGMTNDLMKRVFEHKEGRIAGFTKTYGVKTLVYFEEWPTALSAIHREKRLKKWPRRWKINLIRTDNPSWIDLAADWYPKALTAEEIDARLKALVALPR